MSNTGVSIITATNRPYCIDNLINNFLRQNIENKELIIVINNNNINIDSYNKFKTKSDNIQVYKLDENITLGSCLNFATDKCKFSIISKFDDDDYYGPLYLNEVLDTFNKVDCQVIGKTKTYVYFEKYNKLTLKKLGKINSFVDTVLGSTICFKKELLNKISFRSINIGEDKYFCNDCLQYKYKIYSTTIYNYITFKHEDMKNHTFSCDLNFYMNLCSNVKDNLTFEESFLLVNNMK